MRGPDRKGVSAVGRRSLAILALLAGGLAAGACSSEKVEVPGKEGALKNAALVRAERRAYDGAPPVIPHEDFAIACTGCHNDEGMSVPEVGYAPPMPHLETRGLSDHSRCRQCHVFGLADDLFVASEFAGLGQDLRRGGRLHDLAPPTIPHKIFMRENCAACHAGPAAREEIRTSHPERSRCRQCHVAVTERGGFEAGGEEL